jgi:hypothetical protein
MSGRTEKHQLSGIKKLVGTLRWHLHPLDQELVVVIKQHGHLVSWQTQVVSQAIAEISRP